MSSGSKIIAPEFWEKAWVNFLSENRRGEKGNPLDQAEQWNRRADSFSRRVGGAQGNRRLEQVFRFLQQEDVLKDNSNILDIGCGPGSFAVPLAEAGHSVVALDPAQKMLDILRERITPGHSGRVITVLGLWEEIDINKMGWEKQFDLVFASMIPGVRDIDTLQKMIACSREWCYLSSFSGPRRYSLFEEVHLELLGKPFLNHFNDIIFPFNILYALGYRPRLTFAEMNQHKVDSIEDAVADLMDHFKFFAVNEDIHNLKEKVYDLVVKKAVDGKVAHEIRSNIGMMLWRQCRPKVGKS